jgi:hypothetical protein
MKKQWPEILNYHVFHEAYRNLVLCDGLADRCAPPLRWTCN